MTPAGYVGNDVVDLAHPRTHGRSSDHRFVERVCDEAERMAIREARDPDLELWCLWAAKETAFKVVSKVLGTPPPFAHRRFRVEWGDGAQAAEPLVEGAGDLVRRGRVVHATAASGGEGGVRLETPVVVHLSTEGAVHAVGCVPSDQGSDARLEVTARVAGLDGDEPAWRGDLAELTARLTAAEADAVHSRASAAVRLAARAHLADRLRLEERRLQIVCAPGPTSQRPPRVLVDGAPAGADVSLSHDGRWIAWALCVEGVSP